MKTAVAFKWTRDPQDARVAADGTVTWPNVKFSATDDDPAAMAVATALAPEEEIVGITIGDGKPEWAAARGAASTVIVEDAFGGADGTAAARAIAGAVRAQDAQIVVMGDSEWDRGVVSALIGELGWPAYAGVTAAKLDGDAIELTVKRGSNLEIIRTAAPVVLAAVALSQETNAPGMKQTLAARKKPVEKVTVADLNVEPGVAESRGTRLPVGDSAVLFDGNDPQAAVSQLLDALRGEGVL